LVRVRGWAGDDYLEYVYRFKADDLPNHDFVPRLWATRRVGALLDQVRTVGWSQRLEDEIRELGLGYGVVTPYTEFVIEDQDTGAASADNMALYSNAELNQASGRVAIEARLQNQAYQQAAQADLAQGANLVNYGQHSLAEIGAQQVDLSLLQGRQDLDEPITGEWLEDNLPPSRLVEFGSEEYFALASDPEVRPYLQSGREVVFSYQGEVIAVSDQKAEIVDQDRLQEVQSTNPALHGKTPDSATFLAFSTAFPWLHSGLALVAVLLISLCLLLTAAVLGYLVRVIVR